MNSDFLHYRIYGTKRASGQGKMVIKRGTYRYFLLGVREGKLFLYKILLFNTFFYPVFNWLLASLRTYSAMDIRCLNIEIYSSMSRRIFFFENSGINIQVCMVQCESSIQAEVFSLRVISERRRNKGNPQFIQLSAAIMNERNLIKFLMLSF